MNLCELLKLIEAKLFPPGDYWFYYFGTVFFVVMLAIWYIILPFGMAAYIGYCYISGYCLPDITYFPYQKEVAMLLWWGEIIIKVTVPFFVISFIFDLIPILKKWGVLK